MGLLNWKLESGKAVTATETITFYIILIAKAKASQRVVDRNHTYIHRASCRGRLDLHTLGTIVSNT
jgi:hypothetical protein